MCKYAVFNTALTFPSWKYLQDLDLTPLLQIHTGCTRLMRSGYVKILSVSDVTKQKAAFKIHHRYFY
jgi:hypothetical protein